MPDFTKFKGNLAVFPQTTNGSLIEVNIDLHCHYGNRLQHASWEWALPDEHVSIIPPAHPAYNFLLNRRIQLLNADFDAHVPPPTIAYTSFSSPVFSPGPLARDENGQIHPGVQLLLDDTKLLSRVLEWAFFNLWATLQNVVPAARSAAFSPAAKTRANYQTKLRKLLEQWRLVNLR